MDEHELRCGGARNGTVGAVMKATGGGLENGGGGGEVNSWVKDVART